ncbi:MAG: phosphoglycerate kinase [Legionellales bacterium RIFCSPHIGHO2_12_FULL_37_14]|nr:MAG: phosphoglycerate kinase [Legionellales bacterium RIFCSPHIGHO2_12_FULL_37_14]
MTVLTMNDMDLAGKRVLIREDLNVPIMDGIITSDQRLLAVLPTLEQALSQGAAVMVMSHLGRPTEGVYEERYSLKPVATYFSQHLSYPVHFAKNYLEGVDAKPSELVVLENIRFNAGEKACDPILAKKLAALCDVFIMDAFATSHRKHASTCGVAEYAPVAMAGPLLLRELEALKQAMVNPESPIVVIVGGSKISTKLSLLNHLIEIADVLIPGGGIANTFLKASNIKIGISLYEESMLAQAKEIMEQASTKKCEIMLPTDVVVGKSLSETCPAFNKVLSQIADDDMILDIGPDSISRYVAMINQAKTVVWNGPLGVFEFPQFSYGTRSIAIAVANSEAFSIAGGGETLAAIDQYNLTQQISYVSTGGAAFLECLEGKTLPAMAILEARYTKRE